MMLWILLILSTDASIVEVEVDRDFAAALATRGLGSLLDVQERLILERRDLQVDDRLEVSLSVANRMMEESTSKAKDVLRRPAWTEAMELMDSAIDESHRGSVREKYRLQWGYSLLRHSLLLSEYAALVSNDGEARESAVGLARNALQQIRTAAQAIEKELETRSPSDAVEAGVLPWDELVGLAGACELGLGAAWLGLAKAETEERIRSSALSEARALLSRYADSVDEGVVAVEAKTLLAEVDWLEGEMAAASRRLEEALKGKGSKEQEQRASKLLARIELARDRPENAVAALMQGESEHDGEWEVILIESALRRRAAMLSHAPREGERLLGEAMDALSRLQREHGGYWQQRGEAVAARLLPPEDVGSEPRVVVRLAHALRAAGDVAGARRLYERGLALTEGDDATSLAVETRLGMAECLADSGEFGGAKEAFVAIWNESEDPSIRSRAVLSALHSADREWRQSESEALKEEYWELLTKGAAQVDADTADSVQWMRGMFAEEVGRTEDALASYGSIGPESRWYDSAVLKAVAIEHRRLLGMPEEDREKRSAAIRSRVGELRALVATMGSNRFESKPEIHAAALLAFSALVTLDVVDDWESARELLDIAWRLPISGSLREQVASKRVQVCARIGDYEGASAILAGGNEVDPRFLKSFLANVDLDDSQHSEEERLRLAKLVERMAESALSARGAIDAEERYHLRRLLAESRLANGDALSAEPMFARLLEERPSHLRVVRGLARSTFSLGDVSRSLRLWQQLQRGLERGSDEWLEAVYYVIRCQEMLGEGETARRNFARFAELHPDLGGSAWSDSFEALSVRLGVKH